MDICQELLIRRHELSCLLIGGFSGDREYQEKILDKIEILRSQKVQIDITGFIPHDEVFPWLSRTRILIIPSMDEGFGRMAIEAMACGIPVIANPVGGLLEIIDHEINGYLSEFNRLDSFVQIADDLLGNPILCQKLGNHGVMKVKSQFSIEKITSAYEDLYKRITLDSK